MVRVSTDQISILSVSILYLCWALMGHIYSLIQIAKNTKEIFILVLTGNSLHRCWAFRYSVGLQICLSDINPFKEAEIQRKTVKSMLVLVKQNKISMECTELGDLVPYCPEAKIKQPN